MGEENVNSAESTSSQDVAQASSVTSSAEDACTITSSAPVMIMSSARSSASNVHVVAPNVRSAVAPNLPYVPYDRINLALQQAQAALQVASEHTARERVELEHMISEHMPHGHPMGVPIAAPSAPPMSTVQYTHLGFNDQHNSNVVAPNVLSAVVPSPLEVVISSAIQRAQAAPQVESERTTRGPAELEHMPHGHPVGVPIAVPSAPPMPTTQYTHSGSNDLRNSNFTHNSYLSGVSSGTSQQRPAAAPTHPIDALQQMDRHQLMTESYVQPATSNRRVPEPVYGQYVPEPIYGWRLSVQPVNDCDQHSSNFTHNPYLSGVSSGASQQQAAVAPTYPYNNTECATLLPLEREALCKLNAGIHSYNAAIRNKPFEQSRVGQLVSECAKTISGIALRHAMPPHHLVEPSISEYVDQGHWRQINAQTRTQQGSGAQATRLYPSLQHITMTGSTMPAGEPSTGIGQQQPDTIDELSNSSPAERTSPLAQQPGQPQAQSQERDTPTQLLDQASASRANDRVVRK